jgi:DNA recombination protein RmuC
MAEWMTWLLLVLGGLNLVLLVVLWLTRQNHNHSAQQIQQAQQQSQQHVQQLQQAIASSSERLERELRTEVQESARGGRQEIMQTLATFQHTLVQQSAEATRTQNSQMDAFAQQLGLLQKTLSDTLTQQVQMLSESNARRLSEMRGTLETQLAQLQQSNTSKLTLRSSCNLQPFRGHHHRPRRSAPGRARHGRQRQPARQ